MTSCACDPTPVTFGVGVVLLRCSAHDRQTWLVDGEPAEPGAAFGALRELFVEQRRRPTRRPDRRPAPTTAAPTTGAPTLAAPAGRAAPRVVTLPDAGDVTDAALTALLQARGLQGSWAIA